MRTHSCWESMHTVGPRAAGKVEFLTASPEAPAGQRTQVFRENQPHLVCEGVSLQVLLIQRDIVKHLLLRTHTSVRNLTKSKM